ncbi:MAG TPA: DUF5668 domain-containing protein [Candidatus Angelobacter sp.]|nr:DUF5668 domain-containing protein [Candidatus Angelobacter sp.]
MSDRIRCACRRCTIRGLMGPAIIITIGLLFLLDQMRGDNFSFSNTWPIILLVIGAIQLASALSSTAGHSYGPVPPVPPGAVPPAPPQNPYPGQGQGQ